MHLAQAEVADQETIGVGQNPRKGGRPDGRVQLGRVVVGRHAADPAGGHQLQREGDGGRPVAFPVRHPRSIEVVLFVGEYTI
jgi:hypothetical protein